MKIDMETELIGNEITYLRPKHSRKDNMTDVLLAIAAIGAIAFALWGLVATQSLPLL